MPYPVAACRGHGIMPAAPGPAGLTGWQGDTAAYIFWTATTGANSYSLERSPNGAGTWSVIATTVAANFTDTGLTNASAYDYRVRSLTGAAYSGYSATITVTPVAWAVGQFTGVNLWVEADSGVYQDAARTTPVTADGDTILGLTDQSGNGYHPTQASSTKKAIYKTSILNGHPAIRCSSAPTAFTVSNSVLANRANAEVYCAFSPGSTITGYQCLFSGDSSDNFFVGIPSTSQLGYYLNGYTPVSPHGASLIIASTPVVGTWTKNGTAVSVRMNGYAEMASTTETQNNTTLASGRNLFASGGTTEDFKGDVFAIIVCPTPLSAQKQWQMEQGLMLKYPPTLGRAIQYPLNEGSGTTAANAVDGSYNLTLTGSPTWSARGLTFDGTARFGSGTNGSPPTWSKVSVYGVVKQTAAGSNNPILSDLYANGKLRLYGGDGSALPAFRFNGSVIEGAGVDLYDGNAHVVAGVYDAATLYFYVDGTLLYKKAAAVASISPGTLLLGKFDSGTPSYFTGDIDWVEVYPLPHSAAQVAATTARLASSVATRLVSVATSIDKWIACEGDSITDPYYTGGGLTPPDHYPYKGMELMSPKRPHWNYAVSGSTVATMTTRAAAGIQAAIVSTRSRNILSVMIGRNDLGSDGSNHDAATFVADLKTYCLAQRTAGYNKIVLCTVLPSTLSGFNAKQAPTNTAIRADPSFYDVLCDFDTVSQVADGTIASDTTNYSLDGTHLKGAGHALLAQTWANAIAAAL